MEVLAAAPLLGSLVGDFESSTPEASPNASGTKTTSKPKPAGGALGARSEESTGIPPLPGIARVGDDPGGRVELIAAPALLALLFGAVAWLVVRRRSQPRW